MLTEYDPSPEAVFNAVIPEYLYGVLYGGLSAKDGIRMLLARPRKGEHEEVWLG